MGLGAPRHPDHAAERSTHLVPCRLLPATSANQLRRRGVDVQPRRTNDAVCVNRRRHCECRWASLGAQRHASFTTWPARDKIDSLGSATSGACSTTSDDTNVQGGHGRQRRADRYEGVATDPRGAMAAASRARRRSYTVDTDGMNGVRQASRRARATDRTMASTPPVASMPRQLHQSVDRVRIVWLGISRKLPAKPPTTKTH